MTDAYVIEVGGRTVGIVARDSHDHGFKFFSAVSRFNVMEGQSFPDPLAAERMARALSKNGHLPASRPDGRRPRRDQGQHRFGQPRDFRGITSVTR